MALIEESLMVSVSMGVIVISRIMVYIRVVVSMVSVVISMWSVRMVVEWVISEVKIISIHVIKIVLIFHWLWWLVVWMGSLKVCLRLWCSLHVLSLWSVGEVTVWKDDVMMVIRDWAVIIYWLWSGNVEMVV